MRDLGGEGICHRPIGRRVFTRGNLLKRARSPLQGLSPVRSKGAYTARSAGPLAGGSLSPQGLAIPQLNPRLYTKGLGRHQRPALRENPAWVHPGGYHPVSLPSAYSTPRSHRHIPQAGPERLDLLRHGRARKCTDPPNHRPG